MPGGRIGALRHRAVAFRRSKKELLGAIEDRRPRRATPRPGIAALLALSLASALVATEQVVSAHAGAHEPGGTAPGSPVVKRTIDDLVKALSRKAPNLEADSAAGGGARQEVSPAKVREQWPEQSVVETLRGVSLAREQAAALWDFFADDNNADLVSLPIVRALVTASDTPKAREAMWSELGGIARGYAKKERSGPRERSLLGIFERHRSVVRPLITELAETESSGDEMVDLIQSSRALGASPDDSLAWVGAHHPAAVARRMERERSRGRPVTWEETAFKLLVRWKQDRLVPGAPKAARSLAQLDADGETFITIFNNLHAHDESYRKTFLRGLGPVEVFNAVVGGEVELYRLGTSSYRDFLHAIVMQGIRQQGSFEAFLDYAVPRRLGDVAVRASGRRAIVLLRVLSSFGLLDEVLATVRDQSRFIDDALASLGDPASFEGNASVVMDVLTARATTVVATGFRRALLDKLYQRYGDEREPRQRSVYGSMLSVYQTVTGDRRDKAIDIAFPLDDAMFRVPFDRLFSREGKGTVVHRMFMRLDEDTDAASTYASFRFNMRKRGASIQDHRHFEVARLVGRGRTVEIYFNKPTAVGVKRGIDDIAAALKGRRVETIVGRGHTSIVKPLQENAKRILGDRLKMVATVMVGTCGGDASVRELIDTFGYLSYFTTRSTGRQILNNALVDAYIDALLALAPDRRLHLTDVLGNATSRFLRRGGDAELRDDASFYRVNMTSVLTAVLFDGHVRRRATAEKQVAEHAPVATSE